MLIQFGAWFYASMCLSIVAALLLEAALPIDRRPADYTHMLRNFALWAIAFLCADIVVGIWWLDFPSLLGQPAFGLFYWLPLSDGWIPIVIGVVLIDLADYAFHRLTHHLPVLWRFHSIHHTDPDMDVSTTLRFHPVDLVLGNFWRAGAAFLLGLPLWILAFREVLIFPLAFMQHARVKLPERLERTLGQVLVTPAIHRVHHSTVRAEHDRNYGGGLVWWDRLFGSFRAPEAGHPAAFGLAGREGPAHQTIHGMLLVPFKANQKFN